MSKRSKRRRHMRFASSDPNVILHIDAIDVTRMRMPKYDGFACRGGVHGDTSYNRRKFKQETLRIIREDY